MGHVTKHRIKRGNALRLSPIDNWTARPKAERNRGEPRITHIQEYTGPEHAHRFDQWSWPFPPANTQYTFFNAWLGNQMPGFEKNPFEGDSITRDWAVFYSQQAQEHQRGGSYSSTGMGAQESQSILQQLAALWSQRDGE